MQYKLLFPIIFTFFLSALINYFSHNNLFISLMNPLTYVLSIHLFKTNLITKNFLFKPFLIILFALIPLFYYLPNHYLISLLPLFSLVFLYLYNKFPSRYLIIIWGISLFFGNLYSSGLIEYPFKIQSSQLIFNSPEINYNIQRHQQDALFIPYRVRLLVYSQLIYIYAFLTNLFNFLNLKNLYDILLIANIYPFFTGIYILIKQKSRFKDICLTAFLITALTVGIDRSSENFKSLYLLGPIFIYLILLGSQIISRKIYVVFWILSFFLLISKI